jgi:excisionase family DNA binding protein
MRLCGPGQIGMVMGMEALAPPNPHRPTGAPPRSGLTRDQVMTAAEVAELLGLPVSTVYYLARRGDIPAARFGRAYRFLRPRIEDLLGA